ncbi:MAG: MarR family transcriptional regulator [Bacteroidetes bacterium]|nr:MarR family transcriptional regulator [Bacteroidota bacterium]
MKIEEAIKQKKFESLQQKAVINLIYTYHYMMDKQQAIFTKNDLTAQQFNVLRILRGKLPNSMGVGEVKEVMLDKNPDLTRLCDRLLKKKLIERFPNKFNKRQMLLKITKEGLHLLKKIDPHIKKQQKKMPISNKEAEILSDILDKLRK